MAENNWDLTAFHAELLYIFREFEKVCIKYNLRYYSSGGTTIGALRHGGFIPWDDDMDIEMPRADFVKFLEVYEKEVPEHLRIKRGGSDGPIWGCKLVDGREGLKEKLERKSNLTLPCNPFIDIFYIDGVPEKVTEFRQWRRKRMIWRMCQLYRYPETGIATPGHRSFKYFVSRFIGFFISLFYPRTKDDTEMMNLQDRVALRWPFDECYSVVEPAFFADRTKRITPKHWYGEGRVVKFEDGTIRVPAHAEDRCMMDHMDWRQLPPIEWRIPEHALRRAYNHV